MIGGLPMNALRCDECGERREVIWLGEDLRVLCEECMVKELGGSSTQSPT